MRLQSCAASCARGSLVAHTCSSKLAGWRETPSGRETLGARASSNWRRRSKRPASIGGARDEASRPVRPWRRGARAAMRALRPRLLLPLGFFRMLVAAQLHELSHLNRSRTSPPGSGRRIGRGRARSDVKGAHDQSAEGRCSSRTLQRTQRCSGGCVSLKYDRARASAPIAGRRRCDLARVRLVGRASRTPSGATRRGAELHGHQRAWRRLLSAGFGSLSRCGALGAARVGHVGRRARRSDGAQRATHRRVRGGGALPFFAAT